MDFKNERLMMSKEEARNRAKELFNENQVDLITKYMFLEQQVKKQKEVIDKIATRLEYFLIGNLKYQSSQEEFIKLLNILKEVSE